MKNWQIDLLDISEYQSATVEAAFQRVVRATTELGFEYCSYGYQSLLPLSRPKTFIYSNYPDRWMQRYQAEGYIGQDPAVIHCRQSEAPFVWGDSPLGTPSPMWEEARDVGLRHGWAQSSLIAPNGAGMLTLSRSSQSLSSVELLTTESKMRWLTNVSHFVLSKLLMQQARAHEEPHLTRQEAEVLKWTADGKTSGDIGVILGISENTVNFHIKNAISKLRAANKTAAVVKAALLGLLS